MISHYTGHSPWTLRAVQLDLARQMETVEFICRYIDAASTWGFNTLVLYLEGRVQTPAFPYRPRETSYTLEEMAQVVRHAQARGMEVVPAIASLAHCEQFFEAPELAHLAEERDGHTRFGGNARVTFCPSLPETYAFFTQYIRELAQVFTSPHIHIGCDEAWNLGFCDLCRERRQRDGLGSLFTRHLQQMHAICRALGKRMWIWDDFFELFPAELAQTPRDIIMCHWNYNADIAPEGAQAHFANRWRTDWLASYEELGFDALICPWNGLANIDSFTAYARRHRVLGGLLTQWEMSGSYHEEAAPTVAYCGKLWGDADGDAERAWEAALDAVLPAQPAPVQAAARTLTSLPRLGLRAHPRAYLTGPLSEGEAVHRTAVQAGLQLLRLARAQQPVEAGAEVLDELDLVSRISLLSWELRALLPAIYDPRRPAADLSRLTARAQACRQELDELIALRAPVHEARRPGMHPRDGAVRYLRAVRDGLAPAWERLARPTTPEDWWLVLRLFLPDTHGSPRLKVTALSGTATRVLLEGGYKPSPWSAGCYYTICVPFSAPAAPDAIRLEGWGYGGQGIAYVELYNTMTALVPAAVRREEGPIYDPQALLRDDTHWTYLGHTDILAAIHAPELADERGIIEVALREKSVAGTAGQQTASQQLTVRARAEISGPFDAGRLAVG